MAEKDDTDKPGLYYGVVSVLTGEATRNCFGYGYCASGAEFIGMLLNNARKEFPQGPILNTAYYRVPDSAVLDAAERIKGVA